MSGNYVTLSLETHLFFGRIMKEHSLFLMAGFPGKNADYIEKADWYINQFEELLKEVVELSQGRVSDEVLLSGETVTEYTLGAEHKTCDLTGIEIDTAITERQLEMVSDCDSNRAERRREPQEREQRNREVHNREMRNREVHNREMHNGEMHNREMHNREMHNREMHNRGRHNREWQNRNSFNNQERNRIGRINRKALQLVEGLIDFKEDILKNVSECCLFTVNYPLLIEHILREARMYRSMINELERRGTISSQSMLDMEVFWNQIMMEHAQFIRGLLDPCEEELICKAHEYSLDYSALLEEARRKDCMANDDLTRRTHDKTVEYRDFKAAGTKGISQCEISSIILPLLADHVLREANHYLRLLEQ